MCGFVGILSNKHVSKDILEKSINSISYRGPDDKKILQSDYYNFAASKPLKFVNVIKLIKKILNSKSQIINQKKIKKSFTISNRKISKEFNFKVATTVKIITRCCKEIANNRYSNKFNLSTK